MKNLYIALVLSLVLASSVFAGSYGSGFNSNVSAGENCNPLFTGEILSSLEDYGGAFTIGFTGETSTGTAVILDNALSVPADSVWCGTFETLGVSEGNDKSFFYESQFATIRESSGTLSISLGSATNASDTITTCVVTPAVNDTTKKVYISVTGVSATDIKWVGKFSGVRVNYPEE